MKGLVATVSIVCVKYDHLSVLNSLINPVHEHNHTRFGAGGVVFSGRSGNTKLILSYPIRSRLVKLNFIQSFLFLKDYRRIKTQKIERFLCF